MRSLFLLLIGVLQTVSVMAQDVINLAGEWEFKLDPNNKGIEERWFETASLADIIRLPGCLQEQGYGDVPNINTTWWTGEIMPKWFDERPWLAEYKEVSNFKTQEFLVPDRHYLGAAWYAINITIPEAWQSHDVNLFLERCHWQTKFWIDGTYVGENNSLGTPHIYNSNLFKPGKHRIVIRVDNSSLVNVGNKAHSVSEETAGTWNGIVGKMELQKVSSIALDNVQLYPDIDKRMVKVVGTINTKLTVGKWKLFVDVEGINKNTHKPNSITLEGAFNSNDTGFSFEFPMGSDMKLWDEFDPNLYEMTMRVSSNKAIDKASFRFGMRKFESQGTQFVINGVKTFIRGNVDCAVFPKTGYAPMDVASWKQLFKTYKNFGLNMARFHSWCPPEAAFVAADEVGIYLAPEVGEWGFVSKQTQFEFFESESQRILNTYGNHPSFIQMGLGNESNAKKEFSKPLIDKWKAKDSRHLYTIKANSGSNPDNIDYEVVRGIGDPHVKMRYQGGWPPKPMNSDFQNKEPNTQVNWNEAVSIADMPLIQHETAQICAYPDIDNEISKYSGYLNPTYLEIAQDQLRKRGMEDQVSDFVESSGKWQVELTKEEFEAAYRTKGLAGFHWLCLADFTGQDTAPVGFTDAFYDTKSYVNEKSVRDWNAPTVLLAAMPHRVYTSIKDFKADILISHFGKHDLDVEVVAKLKDESGTIIESWALPSKKITQGNAQMLGGISVSSAKIDKPTHLILEVTALSQSLYNSWDLWVYPEVKTAKVPKSITVAKKWSTDIEQKLNEGETVLLLPEQNDLKGQLPICFTGYYWTSFGENEGQSSAAGVLIDTKHPVFKDFSTQSHVNWQWWDVLTHAHPMIIDSYDAENPWPKDYKPVLQPIDTWKINRKLTLLSEVKVGKGKLLICSIDIETDLDKRPVTKQFRKNLLEYMASKGFNPQLEVSTKAIKEVFLQ